MHEITLNFISTTSGHQTLVMQFLVQMEDCWCMEDVSICGSMWNYARSV